MYIQVLGQPTGNLCPGAWPHTCQPPPSGAPHPEHRAVCSEQVRPTAAHRRRCPGGHGAEAWPGLGARGGAEGNREPLATLPRRPVCCPVPQPTWVFRDQTHPTYGRSRDVVALAGGRESWVLSRASRAEPSQPGSRVDPLCHHRPGAGPPRTRPHCCWTLELGAKKRPAFPLLPLRPLPVQGCVGPGTLGACLRCRRSGVPSCSPSSDLGRREEEGGRGPLEGEGLGPE